MNAPAARALVSVIVPAHNAGRFLQKCLSSILGQTHRDLEVILVDDGSSDATESIGREFSASDGRVRCLRLDENVGVHRARMAGIARSLGDYIGFVDADDWLRDDMVSTTLARLQVDGSDIAICGVAYPDDEGKEVRRRFRFKRAYRLQDGLADFAALRLGSGYLWNKLYRRDVILGSAAWALSERIVLGEDYIVNVGAFRRASSVSLLPEVLYFYRQHPESAIQKVSRSEAFVELLRAYRLCLRAYSKQGSRVLDEIDRLYAELFSFDSYAVHDISELAPYRREIAESLSEISAIRAESASSFVRANGILLDGENTPAVRRFARMAGRKIRKTARFIGGRRWAFVARNVF